ncbi:hypothetical protein J0A67_16590 [Algoriphagus aestuariicola]|uniref:DUF4369 domain-containing protein n=1 Tax=Algoriphagus aestuariicola TaxID=1852016 RepID=A0ABS3BT82_9BACT|nr:hypothetical protein [Algoriphagus aestuariicola]MBN7802494.1 hypothetical protein [Algoriphagus aestuariicola]
MKRNFYFLVFAVFLITSCKDDEAPRSFLNGTYERTGIISETGIYYVLQYIFTVDGTFERITLVRQDGLLLGYNYYAKGTFKLRGEEFTLLHVQMAGLNYEDYPEGYVESLDLLEDYSIEPMESKGTLRQIDRGEKIAILMECNDVIGYSSMCIGEQVFEKVD